MMTFRNGGSKKIEGSSIYILDKKKQQPYMNFEGVKKKLGGKVQLNMIEVTLC